MFYTVVLLSSLLNPDQLQWKRVDMRTELNRIKDQLRELDRELEESAKRFDATSAWIVERRREELDDLKKVAKPTKPQIERIAKLEADIVEFSKPSPLHNRAKFDFDKPWYKRAVQPPIKPQR